MDADFIERLQSIHLTEEEGEVIKVRSENRVKILEECSLNLMDRFHMTKPINLWAAKNLLRSVWKLGHDLKIMDVDLINEEARKDIGGGIGRVLEVDCKAIAADQARFLQIRVELPLDKPIRRGAPVLSSEGVTVQIAFQYERLVGLCFRCGKLGHEAKEYLSKVSATTVERLYGEWLKAGFRHQAKIRW